MKILITNKQKKIEFTPRSRALIKKAVRYVLENSALDNGYEISVSIVDNEQIRTLNSRYRNIDKETDVLSFPMLEFVSEEEPYETGGGPSEEALGDIVISLEKAVAQAQEYGHTAEREIAFLTVHSMLHLLGYDHIEDKDRKKMRAREKQILKELDLEEEYDR